MRGYWRGQDAARMAKLLPQPIIAPPLNLSQSYEKHVFELFYQFMTKACNIYQVIFINQGNSGFHVIRIQLEHWISHFQIFDYR